MAMYKEKKMKGYDKPKGMKGGYGEGFVVGHDPMVGRDSHAGLPDNVVMKNYPKSKGYSSMGQDDSMSGIDRVNMESEGKADKYYSNQK